MRIVQGRLEGSAKRRVAAFTLIEAMMAVLIAAVMLVALYGCFASGYSMLKVTREDLRATQIIVQRMERLRLCSFDQVRDPVVNPPVTQEYFNPNSSANGGVLYTVTFSNRFPQIGTIPGAYRTNMLLVTVNASWTSGKVKRNRSMQTYVARQGLEEFVSDGK